MLYQSPITTTRTPAQVYEDVFVPAMFRPCVEELFALVRPRPGERVLDLACGTGVVARTTAPLVGVEGHVGALDLRPGLLAVGAALPAPQGAAIEWREGDALELPYADGSFELVLCQQGLQYLPDRPRALREMRRVLARGGRLGLAVWHGLERNEFMRRLCEAELGRLSPLGLGFEDVAAPFLLGDAEELRRLVGAAGFSDVVVEERVLEARFASPETFVADVEFAYSAVIPQFSEDPAAFAAFVAAGERDTRDLVDAHTEGGEVVFDLAVNLARATA